MHAFATQLLAVVVWISFNPGCWGWSGRQCFLSSSIRGCEIPQSRATTTDRCLFCQVDEDVDDNDKKLFGYSAPSDVPMTESQKALLRYVQELREDVSHDDDDDDSEGQSCEGEPSVDPSRTIRPNQGDSEWIEDW